MKYFVPFIFLLGSQVFAAQQYEDMPVNLDKDIQSLLVPYKEQAINNISLFNRKFKAGEGRVFYVVTKIHDKDKFEQVFVKVAAIEGDSYIGSIASNPTSKIKFKSGDPINVNINDVEDWSIVTDDGKEEGNLQGKVLDLAQVGTAVFLYKMIPDKGKYTSFKIISVLNPKTKQEIIDIVPAARLTDAEALLFKTYGGTKAEDEKEKFSYVFAEFPGWRIVKGLDKK